MTNNKKILIFSSIFTFILSFIFTIFENQFLIELLAPVVIWLTFFLLISNMQKLGPYKYSCAFMAIGFLCLAIIDCMRFTNHYILKTDPYSLFMRFFYVLPSFFFAMNETIYLYLKLRNRKRDLLHLFVNSFCMSVIGFVIMYRLYYLRAGIVTNLVEFSYIFFIFICFYVCMMCLQTFFLVGRENILRGTNLITVALMVYEIMDIQYVFAEAVGMEPDSNWGDLAYLLCIIVIAIGTTIQIQKNYVFDFKKMPHTLRATKVKLVLSVVGIFLSILAGWTSLLAPSDVTNIIIVLLAYIIMAYILFTGEIREHHNEILEEKVKAKTKELEDANSKLEMMSSTDPLTKLYNRRFCDIFLNDLIRKEDSRFAVFSIDLNKFKPVNDTYGHEMGDKVLEEFGKRMLALPQEYTAFRTGGDEFLIVLDMREGKTSPQEAADKLHELYRTPIKYESYIFNLSASIGIAIYPDDSSNIDILLQYADVSMYTIKRSSNKDGYRFFEQELTSLISLQQSLLAKLKNAVPDTDFILYYQPQMDIYTDSIVGFEVFPHLKGDMENVSPADLIPAAEESGIMSSLGIWLMRSALTQIKEWNEKYDKNFTLTVNLSPLQLIDVDYFAAIFEMLKELDVSPSAITLDVANSIIMGAASSAKESMKVLHERGFQLSLNDFGGDDINLSYVLECGFTGIKLSRSLIAMDSANKYAVDLIKSILCLAESMHINVTAVGIETRAQEDKMRKLGVHTLQGYLYGRPVNAELVEANYL